jgi:hypothetical protein
MAGKLVDSIACEGMIWWARSRLGHFGEIEFANRDWKNAGIKMRDEANLES